MIARTRPVAVFVAALAIAGPVRAGWVEGPPLPDPRWHGAAAASTDGYVMMFGGRVLFGPNHTYVHGLTKYALVVFDPKTHTWTNAPAMPPYLGRAVAYPYSKAVVDQRLAAGTLQQAQVHDSPRNARYEMPFGGADGHGRATYFIANGAIYFDPHLGRWGQALAPVEHFYPPDPHSNWMEGIQPSYKVRAQGVTATGPDGKMYLVGGTGAPRSQRGDRTAVTGGVDIYDPDTNTWKPGASLRYPRQSLAGAFAKNGKLYVFGGCACKGSIPMYSPGHADQLSRAKAEASAQEHAVAQTEVYDPAADTWSLAAPMPHPRMLGAAAPGADGKIYVIGGQSFWGGDPESEVDVYDPTTDRWSTGPSLRVGRIGHSAVTTGDGTIWVLGGYAATPTIFEVTRVLAGGTGGPTNSVELLKTSAPH